MRDSNVSSRVKVAGTANDKLFEDNPEVPTAHKTPARAMVW
ncbi:MAG: hypothetical protein ACK56R_11160 [Pirellulaceae bacterium]